MMNELDVEGPTAERCPDCKKPIHWRRSRWGALFLGCSGYPKCRWTNSKKKARIPGSRRLIR